MPVAELHVMYTIIVQNRNNRNNIKNVEKQPE